MAVSTPPLEIEVIGISLQDHDFFPCDVPQEQTDRDLSRPVPVSSSLRPDPSSPGYDVFAGDHVERKRSLHVFLKRLTEANIPGNDLACAYLRRLYRRNCKAKTLAANGIHLLQFLEFVEDIGRKSLTEITRRDIEAFVEFWQDRGLKPASVKNKLGSVYAFCNWLVRENKLPAEVVARKFRIKVPDSLPKAMEPEDVRALLAVIEGPRDRAMILVLLRTGMRIGELLRTRVRDVLFEDRKITIYEGEKNLTGRVAYLSEDALEALLAWMRVRDTEKPVLFYAQGRPSMCYSTARSIFFAGLKKAGLEHKGYHLHCLRHTFASGNPSVMRGKDAFTRHFGPSLGHEPESGKTRLRPRRTLGPGRQAYRHWMFWGYSGVRGRQLVINTSTSY